jgi:hypothetical protein
LRAGKAGFLFISLTFDTVQLRFRLVNAISGRLRLLVTHGRLRYDRRPLRKDLLSPGRRADSRSEYSKQQEADHG